MGYQTALKVKFSHFKPLQRIKLHFGSEGMRQQGTHFIDNFFCFMNILFHEQKNLLNIQGEYSTKV